MTRIVYVHRGGCGGRVMFDLTGGWCTACGAEYLSEDDCKRVAGDGGQEATS
jgi:hypothetical protein